MSNVLIIVETPGGTTTQNTYAVVPAKLLHDIKLYTLNGLILNKDDATAKQQEQIINLYKRLGLENGDYTGTDLAQYVEVAPPFTVDHVLRIGWAV